MRAALAAAPEQAAESLAVHQPHMVG
jgi:hypothetical protein